MHAKGIELGAADFINKPPHAPLVLAQVRTCQRLKSLSDSLTGALPDAVTMDFPTGALTRPKLESSLAQEWLRTQRMAAPLAFLIADIVGCCSYKANDDEARGDACLKAVADALRSAAQRSIDRLGRWSGGQFALHQRLPNARMMRSLTSISRNSVNRWSGTISRRLIRFQKMPRR
jgi:PleD family two-component response regulator